MLALFFKFYHFTVTEFYGVYLQEMRNVTFPVYIRLFYRRIPFYFENFIIKNPFPYRWITHDETCHSIPSSDSISETS